jgi:hypothetical protein
MNYSNPVIIEDRVCIVSYRGGQYARRNGLHIHDLETGKKLGHISYRGEYWGAGTGKRLYFPGMLWFSLEGPDVELMNAGGARAKPNTIRAPDISCGIPPAIADGRFVYRSRNAVYCLDLRAPSAATDETEAVVKGTREGSQ